MKKYVPHALFVVLVASVAAASAIKVWTTGETLRASDLNSNFSHIHNTKVGDGIQLVNADVSTTAAIAHNKLATPALVPKLMVHAAGATFDTVCSADPCTMYSSSGVSSVTRLVAGAYRVNFSARADDAFVVLVTSLQPGAVDTFCKMTGTTTTSVNITCHDDASNATDVAFSFLLLDNT